MKLTKYEHACLVIENEVKALLVDPGDFTESLPLDRAYDYVVITHEHADHVDTIKVKAIFEQNPEVHFFVNQSVYYQHIKKHGAQHTIIGSGVTVDVEGFNLEFTGHDHAVIYQTSPCLNNGVIVNGSFYYAGDSFVLPNHKVDLLAVPASAPWMKTAEAMDYIKAVAPKKVFPTHTALLSRQGAAITYRWLGISAASVGAEWIELQTGETLKI